MSTPGWTCPDIDQLAITIRAHVPPELQAAALVRLERVRLANIQLRAAAAPTLSSRARAKVAVEVSRVEDRIAKLVADSEPPRVPQSAKRLV